MLQFRDKRYDSRHSQATRYGIQHDFPFWEDQLTNPNKLMFLKVYVSDITKEAIIETMLSNNFVTNFKWHSSRLKLKCSWILVHLLPFMQLVTFFSSWICKKNESLLLIFCLWARAGNDNTFELMLCSRYSLQCFFLFLRGKEAAAVELFSVLYSGMWIALNEKFIM